MPQSKTRCLLLVVLSLAFAVQPLFAQDTRWEKYMKAAMTAYQQADYAEAEKQFKAALKEAEKSGEQDQRLGLSLFALGRAFMAQRKYADPEPLFKRSLAILEKALGPEHPDVATSLNNLAGLYHTHGNYAQAEPLFKRSLAIQEKVLGPEHPHLAVTLHNYANLLRKMDRDAEAEEIEARAQIIRAKHAKESPTK